MSDNLVLLSDLIIRNPQLSTFKELLATIRKHGGDGAILLRIREGSRFTIMDLHPVTARRWGSKMAAWATEQGLASRQDGA